MTISGFVTAVVVGTVVGALGRLLVPGRQNLSLVGTAVIGIVAAVLGTLLASLMVDTDGFSLTELLLQIGLAGIGVATVVMMTARHVSE